MAVRNIEELCEKYIRRLPAPERLRLLELTAHGLANDSVEVGSAPEKRSLLDLEGLGAEIWNGVDAQSYVDALRSEWDDRP